MEPAKSERPDYLGALWWTVLTVLTYLAIAVAFVGAGALLWAFVGPSGSSD